jgi:hypothetical protein
MERSIAQDPPQLPSEGRLAGGTPATALATDLCLSRWTVTGHKGTYEVGVQVVDNQQALATLNRLGHRARPVSEPPPNHPSSPT